MGGEDSSQMVAYVIATDGNIKDLVKLKSKILRNSIPKIILKDGNAKAEYVYSDDVVSIMNDVDRQIAIRIESIKKHYGKQ